MPYLKFFTTSTTTVEINGNKLADFATKLPAHTPPLLAVTEALAYVDAFFKRRDLQVQRQKLVQLGEQSKASALDDPLDDAEEHEEEMREAYEEAVQGGGVKKGGSKNAATAAASSSSSSQPPNGTTASDTTTTATTSGNAYGDLGNMGEAVSNQEAAEDDFM